VNVVFLPEARDEFLDAISWKRAKALVGDSRKRWIGALFGSPGIPIFIGCGRADIGGSIYARFPTIFHSSFAGQLSGYWRSRTVPGNRSIG